MKKLLCLSFILAMITSGGYLFADEMQHKHGEMKKMEMSTSENIVDVNNKVCPVLGGPVNGQDFVTYKGKRYGLCCAGCADMFLKDPEKYIKELKTREAIK